MTDRNKTLRDLFAEYEDARTLRIDPYSDGAIEIIQRAQQVRDAFVYRLDEADRAASLRGGR